MNIIIVIAQPASQSSPRFRSIQFLCTFQSVFRTSDLSLQVSEFSDHACRKQIYCMVRAELSQNSVSRLRLSQRIYLLYKSAIFQFCSLARHLYRSSIRKCSKIAPIGTGISTKRRDFLLESSACTHARGNTYL